MTNDQLIALFGIILPILAGIISGYIGYMRGRTSAFREKLYDKQMEAFTEINRTATELRNHVMTMVDVVKLDPETFIKFKDRYMQDLHNIMQESHEALRDYELFIPNNIIDCVDKLYNAVLDHVCDQNFIGTKIRDDFAEVDKDRVIYDVATHHFQLLQEMRRALGTNELTKETGRLIRAPSPSVIAEEQFRDDR